MKKILSETLRPIALIFGLLHHLVGLYQVCSNYAKNVPAPGGLILDIGLYRENMTKSSCLKPFSLEP